jgi:hypothetical protein
METCTLPGLEDNRRWLFTKKKMIYFGVGITSSGLFTIFFVTLIKMEDHHCSKLDQLFMEGQFTPEAFYNAFNYPSDKRDEAEKHLKKALNIIQRLPNQCKSDPTHITDWLDKVGNVLKKKWKLSC